LTAGEAAGQTPTGTVESGLDGARRSGLPAAGACPASMPHPSPLVVHARVRRGAFLVVRVGASVAGAGMNELARDTRPVQNATVAVGGKRVTTGRDGIATTTLRAGRRYRLRVSAGDTFLATQSTVTIPARPR
jgi:hypothetical protein